MRLDPYSLVFYLFIQLILLATVDSLSAKRCLDHLHLMRSSLSQRLRYDSSSNSCFIIYYLIVD